MRQQGCVPSAGSRGESISSAFPGLDAACDGWLMAPYHSEFCFQFHNFFSDSMLPFPYMDPMITVGSAG